MRLTSSIALVGLLIGCAPAEDRSSTAVEPGEGFLQFPEGRVWYRVVGEGDATPLLLLHGGPGAGSRAFEAFEALGDERPVVFYDQLGAGRSDHPSGTTLWTIERHVNEVLHVREALGLDEVHLLGHSWGSILAIEYLVTQPEGVQSVTFASQLFSTERWLRDAKQRVTELPESLQVVIETHEEAGTTDAPEYQGAVMEFYRRYLSRRDPWPPMMDSTMMEFGWEVYGYMWGPSEFTATGTLRDWDRMEALSLVTIPTLFTVGRYDETFRSTVEEYQSRVPNADLVVFEQSGHLTMVDEPDANVQAIREFLREVEKR